MAQDFTSIPTPEALVVTLEMKQLMIQLVSVFLGEASVPPSSFESAHAPVVETGSASAPARPTPAVDILEGLITHMINQFLSMIKYCTELVLFEQSSFEFVRSLLENHIENIEKSGVPSEPKCMK